VTGPSIELEGSGPSITASADGSTIGLEGTGPTLSAALTVSGVPADPADRWTVSDQFGLEFERSTVATNPTIEAWGFDAYFDGSAGGFMLGDDGVTRHYNSSGGTLGTVCVSTVGPDDPFAAPREVVTIDNLPADYNYVSGGPVVDLGGGVGWMVLHLEHSDSQFPTWVYWSLGQAKVTDRNGARSIEYLGLLQTHEQTIAEADALNADATQGSGHSVVVDGFVYVFHADIHAADTAAVGTVSRCELADVRSAVTAGTAAAFRKWSGETLDEEWLEPSVGGSFTELGHEVIGRLGDIVTLPDGRLLWVGTDGDGSTYSVSWAVGSDPLTFTAPTFLSTGAGLEWIYSVLWSGSPASPKVIDSRTALFYLVTSEHPDLYRWDTNSIDRIELTPRPTRRLQPVNITAYDGAGPLTLSASDSGRVMLTGPGGYVVTLPPFDLTTPRTWEVWNYCTDSVTIEADADDEYPLNGSGTFVLNPGHAGTLGSFTGSRLWTGTVVPLGDRRVTGFAAGAGTVSPIESLDPFATFTATGMVTPSFAGILPVGIRFLLKGQTDPTHDGIYVLLGDGITWQYLDEIEQPFRLASAGYPLFVNFLFDTGSQLQGVIASFDSGATYSILPFHYAPAVAADWADDPPSTLAAGLDRLAAHVGPVPPL